jgi:hypothetical protein
MVDCETCGGEILWEPHVVKGKDGKEHYFCCWGCRHRFELEVGIFKPR